ncbi:MAG: DeoR/GlpR transcriptional regulator [Anaerolineae bacterium]|nr:DeoR/GlpR transcriptional regulator [Anaerolineae bacterium]
MTSFERQQRIISLLREQPGMKIPDLAKQLDVSQGTIRNDLDALEQAGHLSRVRGGAILRDERQFLSPSFAARALVNADKKQRIARAAAELVEDGDSIILDASTTVFAMVPFLKKYRNLTIVTNGITMGKALSENSSHTVILIGGVIRAFTDSVSGHLSEEVLDRLHVKTAFVSCSGISLEAGLTEVDIHQIDVKRKMIRSADRVVALVDSSKFNKVDLSSFASIAELSQIITDADIPAEYYEQFKRNCTVLTVCAANSTSSLNPCGADGASR